MRKVKRLITALLILAYVLLPLQRFFYGTWNPFATPNKVYCTGRTYKLSYNPARTLNEVGEPLHLLYSLNLLTGKRLYRTNPEIKAVPTVIYLYVGNGAYQSFELSGGP